MREKCTNFYKNLRLEYFCVSVNQYWTIICFTYCDFSLELRSDRVRKRHRCQRGFIRSTVKTNYKSHITSVQIDPFVSSKSPENQGYLCMESLNAFSYRRTGALPRQISMAQFRIHASPSPDLLAIDIRLAHWPRCLRKRRWLAVGGVVHCDWPR